MKKNIGVMDRMLRIGAAILVSVLVFTGVLQGTLAIILLVLAAVFLLTGSMSFCPVYSLLGINTCKK